MSRARIWIYAIALLIVTGTILLTQVSWILQSARIEERFLNQRVNRALCTAMEVLAKDKSLCSTMNRCVNKASGSFELVLSTGQHARIDSVIREQLQANNIQAPFETAFLPYSPLDQLAPGQAVFFTNQDPSLQNVLVEIAIPSKNDLIRSQINGMFILSLVMTIVLTGVFFSVLLSLSKERKLRKETVDLVNNMAHDLKTPISNISLAMTMAKRNESAENPYHTIMEKEVNRLKQRTSQILGVATVDTFLKNEMVKEAINLHELLTEVMNGFQLQLSHIGGKAIFKYSANNPIVRANCTHLTSAFSNIIHNAIIYNEQVPFLEILTTDTLSGIKIEIRDNGPGIPQEVKNQLFTKGFRYQVKGHHPEGFGMGLYLAKTYIEKQNGSLSVHSDGKTGSTFTVNLQR